ISTCPKPADPIFCLNSLKLAAYVPSGLRSDALIATTRKLIVLASCKEIRCLKKGAVGLFSSRAIIQFVSSVTFMQRNSFSW
ncbi:MAG TPA: hypothetical protein VEP90_13500, partial [Methylomirabilota bacterium]|nr:hypothetical protein [Methylomirabilota bacterium]